MAAQKTKFTVGLFVASGISITLLAIIWLGMTSFFEKGLYYVAYFNESVQGLEIDTPVKYRGVPVGRVESIGVAPDSKLIQVILKIESGQQLGRDIVAQLKSVGITGSMFVELDRKEPGEMDRSPHISFPTEYPVVSSKPSDISELLRGIDDVLNHIKTIDLAGISDKIKLTLDNISQGIADADLKGISRGVESTLENARRILDKQKWDDIITSISDSASSLHDLLVDARGVLNDAGTTLGRVGGLVTDNKKEIRLAIQDLRKALENASTFMEEGTSLAGRTDDSIANITRHLMVIGQNLEKASDNLNRVIDILADQPSQLLFGEPPLPRKLEPDAGKK